jgi:hypothetical protein
MLIIEPTQYPRIKHSFSVGDEVIDVLTGTTGVVEFITIENIIIVHFPDGYGHMYMLNLFNTSTDNVLESQSLKLDTRIHKRWYVCQRIKIKPKC